MALGFTLEAQTKPWLQTYTVVRTRYVSPAGTGQGTSASSPMSMSTAISSAQAGDLIWLAGGTYNGSLNLLKSGSSTKPIIFRATANQRVIINGSVDLSGAYVWLWGVEVSDFGKTSAVDSGVRLIAPGTHLINSVVHHAKGNGIGAWPGGTGSVTYGNIVYENGSPAGHNVYAQNTYTISGYKYFVDNMFLDNQNICDGCFNFHGYGTNAPVTGFHIERNMFRNGKFLVGGYGVPADKEVIKQNYFYNGRINIGWRRPTQVQFLNNYLGRIDFHNEYFWGVGEKVYTQSGPNVYTGNEIYNQIERSVWIQTSIYTAVNVRCDGCTKLQTTDTFDNNKYSTPFTGWLRANNTFQSYLKGLPAWRSATAAVGKTLDANSVEVPPPTTAKIILLKNDYDPNRANLIIYNWGKIANVSVDLSSVVPVGSAYKIYDVKKIFQTSLLSGTYSGPVSIPTGSQEMVCLVVMKQ
jgi:hypothetical protein